MTGYLPGTIAEKVHEKCQHVFEVYIDNVMGYIEKKKVAAWWDGPAVRPKNKLPDEDFMRAIEENADISETKADDFRRSVMALVGHLSLNGQALSWTSNPQLKHAILGYIAEEHPDILQIPETPPKYRRVTDPWEPAW
jgi:predicted Ser/Thr protein kinase